MQKAFPSCHFSVKFLASKALSAFHSTLPSTETNVNQSSHNLFRSWHDSTRLLRVPCQFEGSVCLLESCFWHLAKTNIWYVAYMTGRSIVAVDQYCMYLSWAITLRKRWIESGIASAEHIVNQCSKTAATIESLSNRVTLIVMKGKRCLFHSVSHFPVELNLLGRSLEPCPTIRPINTRPCTKAQLFTSITFPQFISKSVSFLQSTHCNCFLNAFQHFQHISFQAFQVRDCKSCSAWSPTWLTISCNAFRLQTFDLAMPERSLYLRLPSWKLCNSSQSQSQTPATPASLVSSEASYEALSFSFPSFSPPLGERRRGKRVRFLLSLMSHVLQTLPLRLRLQAVRPRPSLKSDSWCSHAYIWGKMLSHGWRYRKGSHGIMLSQKIFFEQWWCG